MSSYSLIDIRINNNNNNNNNGKLLELFNNTIYEVISMIIRVMQAKEVIFDWFSILMFLLSRLQQNFNAKDGYHLTLSSTRKDTHAEVYSRSQRIIKNSDIIKKLINQKA